MAGRRIVPGAGRRIEPQQRLYPIVWREHLGAACVADGGEHRASCRIDRDDRPPLLAARLSATSKNKRFSATALFETACAWSGHRAPEARPVSGAQTDVFRGVTGALTAGEIGEKLASVRTEVSDSLRRGWSLGGGRRRRRRRTDPKLAQLIARPQRQDGNYGKSGPGENPVHDSQVSTNLPLRERRMVGSEGIEPPTLSV